MKPIKRADLDKLRELDSHLADRVLAVFMRQKLAKITLVTPEEIEGAKSYLEKRSNRTFQNFLKLAYKWLSESNRMKGKFNLYCDSLLKAADANGQPLVRMKRKYTRRQKKARYAP